jgi:HSP20 family protein
MDLIPWRQLRDISPLRKEMEDLFSSFFGEPMLPKFLSREWMPSADITETKDKLLVKVELPGLEAKDVNVTISEDLLTIKGEKKSEQEEKDEHHHFVERYYGSFQRSFRLPVSVQTEKIEASFEKGILKIMLPKTEEAKKKEIEIKVK